MLQGGGTPVASLLLMKYLVVALNRTIRAIATANHPRTWAVYPANHPIRKGYIQASINRHKLIIIQIERSKAHLFQIKKLLLHFNKIVRYLPGIP